jgi:hypothetical protein
LPVPEGVYLFTEASLTIDRADRKSCDYVGLQLLSDHSIIEAVNGNLTKSIIKPKELIEAYPGP